MPRLIRWIDAPDFTQEVTLDGTLYRLRATYSTLSGFWTLDIYSRNGQLLCGGVRLVQGDLPLRLHSDPRLPPGQFVLSSNNPGRDDDVRLLYYSAQEVADAV